MMLLSGSWSEVRILASEEGLNWPYIVEYVELEVMFAIYM